MKRSLTKMNELTRITLVGQTEAGSVEVQPARDSRLKATNCCWDGSNTSAIPFYDPERQFRALKCLKKPDKKSPAEGGFIICRRQGKSLNKKVDLSNSH
jgi:hypothetical protein